MAGFKVFTVFFDRYKTAIRSSQRGLKVDIVNTKSHSGSRLASGFSLIELMAVMVIMTVMLALSAPALSSFKNTVGRKGAINQLLNSFEQARVAALTQGAKVYVGFADSSSQFPDKLKCKAYIIFRDRFDDEPATPQFIPLTKWIMLPQGISLQKVNNDQSTLMSDNARVNVDAGCLPLLSGTVQIPALVFNTSGYIESPGNQYLRLLIYEGFHGVNGPTLSNPNNQKFDVIAFRRFSGRAELFLTAGS